MSTVDNEQAVKAAPAMMRRQRGLLAVRSLLALALLYTLYLAKSLLIPIVVALFFALLLSPLVQLCKRVHIPRTISAIILMAMIGVPFTVLGIELAEPAQKWLQRVPELSTQLTAELDALSRHLSTEAAAPATVKPSPPKAKRFGLFTWFSSEEAPAAAPVAEPEAGVENVLSERVMQGGIEIIASVLGATPILIAQFITFVILLLFLLVFGPGLYQGFITLIPEASDKRRAHVLVGRVQRQLSRYIVTVSIINAGLGIVTAGVLWSLAMEDALLWGALVGLLNFAPYVGPIIAMGILTIAGIAQYGLDLVALLPTAVYFGINLLEAQFITPMVLGRHMRLNPLIVILWLLVWGWLWGPAGVLLAVPLLVCIKLVAAQLRVLPFWVGLIETRP